MGYSILSKFALLYVAFTPGGISLLASAEPQPENYQDEMAIPPEHAAEYEKFKGVVTPSLVADFMKEEAYLVKVFKNNHMKALKAAGLIEEFLEFREKYKLDSPDIATSFGELPNFFPYELGVNHDKDGRPILYQPYGTWNVSHAVMKNKTDILSSYLYHALDKAARLTFQAQKEGKQITRFVSLLDGHKFDWLKNMLQLEWNMAFMKMNKVVGKYWPRMMTMYAFVNFFPTFKEMLKKKYLSNETAEYFYFEDNPVKYEPILLQYIAPDQIPRTMIPVMEAARAKEEEKAKNGGKEKGRLGNAMAYLPSLPV